MVALCDLDVLVYRSGWSAKDGDFIQNVECLEGFLHSIYDKVNATDHRLILSGETNFRKEIDPNYKSNRKESARPQYYKELREYCLNELGADLTDGVEADDMLGTLQGEGTIICSNDKDFLQIPGYHLRFKQKWEENEIIYIDEDTAWFNFFKQALVGDKIDNVEGVLNPAKAHHKKPPCFSNETATELLKDLSKSEMLEAVQEMYKIQYGDRWFSFFDKNCRLLFIQRSNAKNYYELI